MERSMSYAVRGETRDRSRFCYESSLSVFTPAPSDLALDDVLAGYTEQLSLMGAGNGGGGGHSRPRLYNHSSFDDEADRYNSSSSSSLPTTRRSRGGRIQESIYPGVYAGSGSGSGSGSMMSTSRLPPATKAIEYLHPRSSASSSVLCSDLDSKLTRRSGGGRYQQRDARDAGGLFGELRGGDEEVSAMRPSKSRRRRRRSREEDDYGDDMSVWPEDSASQVSSRAPSEAWTEVSRGRARRREGSVVSSRSVMRTGRRGFDGRQSVIYEDDDESGYEYGYEQPRGYVTQDITPYVGGAR